MCNHHLKTVSLYDVDARYIILLFVVSMAAVNKSAVSPVCPLRHASDSPPDHYGRTRLVQPHDHH